MQSLILSKEWGFCAVFDSNKDWAYRGLWYGNCDPRNKKNYGKRVPRIGTKQFKITRYNYRLAAKLISNKIPLNKPQNWEKIIDWKKRFI